MQKLMKLQLFLFVAPLCSNGTLITSVRVVPFRTGGVVCSFGILPREELRVTLFLLLPSKTPPSLLFRVVHISHRVAMCFHLGLCFMP